MHPTYHDHVLNVADLVDRPGASRPIDVALALPEGFSLPLVTLHEPLRLDGVLESVVDGILVRGRLSVAARLECARCLEPVDDALHADVVELFADPARVSNDLELPEEGYEVADGSIDLDALLRDALAPAVPFRPLCRPDCRGLCADCGTNLNDAQCGCADEAPDPRWSVLATLDLPSDGTDKS